MAVAWGDYNNDGWLDLYVGKYHINPNSLFRNNHDGTFTDVALNKGVAGNLKYDGTNGPYYGHTAGVGWADFNNNGNLDLWLSNLAHKDPPRWFCDDAQMLKNNGGPFFEFDNIRDTIGIPTTPVGTIVGQYYKDEDFFGIAWGDYDNDCDLDFWVPQVKTYHSWAQSYLWCNNNNETFTDASDSAGIKVWSNTGGVWGDYNNDGFLDLLTEGTYPYQGTRETHLFKNQGNSNNWLQMRLKGVLSNTAAIGARVYLTAGSVTQMREVGGDAGGHAFQNSFNVEFGLGTSTKADDIKIVWPSGVVQVMKNVNANQILNVTENITGPQITATTVSKYQVSEDESLTFSASYTDTISLMQWDYDNDGIIDYECSVCYPPSNYKYTKQGNYTAKVWVWDSTQELGWLETTDFIVVDNVVPTAVAGNDCTVWEDQVVEFDASGSTDTPSDLPNLEYNWSFGDSSYTGWSNSSTTSHIYYYDDDYEVVLKVRDDDLSVDSDVIWITVNNMLPSCNIIVNQSAAEDEVITFKAICNDTPSDISTLLSFWDFGDGNTTYWSTEHVVQHTYTRNGSYNIRCYLRDDDWPKDENYTEAQVIVYNVKPQCELEIKPKLEVEEDEELDFFAIADDSISDKVTIRYFWDFGDGNTSDWLNPGEQNITHAYMNMGLYNAKLIVVDDDMALCEQVVNITVTNVPPKCLVMEEADLEIIEDDSVEFYGSGIDTKSDNELLKFSWSLNVEEPVTTPWNFTSDFVFTFNQSGDYKAVLTVRDDNGATDNQTVKIRVLNLEPIARFLASETTVNEDDIIYFDASDSEDTPTDQETLNYTWDFDDWSPLQYGIKQQWSFSKSDEYKVRLIITDNDGKADVLVQKITVKNVRPTAVITVSEKQVDPDQEITCNASKSTDTPSDLEILKYSWDFGDTLSKSKGSGLTGKEVNYSYSEPGRYTVTLTVIDDEGAQGTATVEIRVKGTPDESEDDKSEDTSGLFLIVVAVIAVIIIIIFIFLIFIKNKRSKEKETTDLVEDLSKPEIAPEERIELKETEPEDEAEKHDDLEKTDTSKTPEIPKTQETPETPETPQTPETPKTPKIFDPQTTPETNIENEYTPEITSTPEDNLDVKTEIKPEIPETPKTPEIPQTPETTETSEPTHEMKTESKTEN
jgi:PKD repeat protein